jgi:alkanesulfonate monooxygenase SsuD/methylene tetrahydromethanopterin reductase-like flavin-dependent oxidoreductase (luciferase family)
MKFEFFHSLGRIQSVHDHVTDAALFHSFLEQTREGEAMGYETVWVAESHFSSEVQKAHRSPVIPNYHGEVGLNADSCQLAQILFSQTKSIGFGTAIFNIVGGNGGPIASADRMRSLIFLNSLNVNPRKLNLGIAAGRFPYINAPFGIYPRNQTERIFWPQVQRLIFLEALEVFLRLSNGETIASDSISDRDIDSSLAKSPEEFERQWTLLQSECPDIVRTLSKKSVPYEKRWVFDQLKLVPSLPKGPGKDVFKFVLGSHDPLARDLALKYADVDIFNLSFTPPKELNKIHDEMFLRYQESGRKWGRGRMPRTVLVFIDKNPALALERASDCFDTYIEAMRGTAVLPPKSELMARALIGTPEMICDQLSPGHEKGFNPEDRLMLWFEFNQKSHQDILKQMRLFAESVISKLS